MICDICGESCYKRAFVKIKGESFGLCPTCYSRTTTEIRSSDKPRIIRFFMKPSKLGTYQGSDDPIYKISIPRAIGLGVDPEHKYLVTLAWDQVQEIEEKGVDVEFESASLVMDLSLNDAGVIIRELDPNYDFKGKSGNEIREYAKKLRGSK